MYTVNDYCRDLFGEKIYKISLNGGMTCPNRDGTCGTKGCIFCSEGGSGDFSPSSDMSIDEQISDAKRRVSRKFKGDKYIAYFQAFSNTYAPVERLRKLYTEVIKRDDIAVLSIATRPDCLNEDIICLLKELNDIKPVWVELGLQTTKDETVKYIRRGYETRIYDDAVKRLKDIGIHVITHVIIGLPGESVEDMLNTVRHVVKVKSSGIKLQLLHVLKGTDLENDYNKGRFEVLSLEEYMDILEKCIEIIPKDMVIHRITGDGPKSLLVAPLWSGDKKRVLNAINRRLSILDKKN
jgi:radical SAM protein (TIGR01212 family)